MKSSLALKTDVKQTDAELKESVLSELAYEPSVKTTDIGVLVDDGTVTLNGFVDSYWEKWGAVAATKRVAGVKAIADDIEVRLPSSSHHSDGDIAGAVASQIEWSTNIPENTVTITVREGVVTLEGEVEQRFQKDAAEIAVQSLMGIKGVSNLLSIKPRQNLSTIETSIHAALERNAVLDSDHIRVKVAGTKVTLTGKVRNHAELDEAERLAWRALGVTYVDNQLVVKS